MTNAVTLSGYTAAQLRTIKNTVAKDTNEEEFNLFMEACRSYHLDPFRRQIHAIVYNKDKPEKRKMTIIVARDGLRAIAQRCRDYRPASEPAQILYDDSAKGDTNPKGIVSATVKLWKQDNRGEWYPVIGEAYWDEFAPVTDEWAWSDEQRKRAPTGKKTVEGNWAKMPIVMITKCAESQALRAGWPDMFGGLYAEEEMHSLDATMTASEALEEHEKQERIARVGGPGLMMVFDDSARLEKVPLGQVHDRVMDFLHSASPRDAYMFRLRNAEALKDYWAHEKAAALSIKAALEPLADRFDPSEAA